MLVASVLYGTGVHWAAIQGAAWGGMIAARVSELSWAEAVSSTFSGEKPCHVCKIVEKGSASQSPMIILSGASVDLAVTTASLLTALLPIGILFVSPSISVASAPSRPSVPPPKAVLPA